MSKNELAIQLVGMFTGRVGMVSGSLGAGVSVGSCDKDGWDVTANIATAGAGF